MNYSPKLGLVVNLFLVSQHLFLLPNYGAYSVGCLNGSDYNYSNRENTYKMEQLVCVCCSFMYSNCICDLSG